MKKRLATIICVLGMTFCLMACGEDSVKETNLTQKTESETISKDGNSDEANSDDSDRNTESDAVSDTQNVGTQTECPLEDGVYAAEFHTDSSMFHVNEACEGKGTLTVKDQKMVIHVSLASKGIVNLFPGLMEDAQKEGAVLLEPTVDTVTYSDGLSDEVYGFDVPVPYLDEEFDLALIGTKGKWYDHKVYVTNVQKESESSVDTSVLFDGTYDVNVTMTGGSGKASIESPTVLTVADGKMTAVLVWSSKNYDYMIVDGEKYLNEAADGENSKFTIPVSELSKELPVIGDTVAMSTPHEIEYTLTFELAE